jgi:L1 cell adhesion molecule like protein
MTQAIGIDLGTTYSCVGMWVTDKVEILSNEIGVNTTPSIVSMVAETLVGDGAKAVMPRNGPNCIYDAKRLIGKKMSDAHVAEDIKGWPFKVEANAEDMPVIKVTMGEEEKEFRAE